MITNAFTTFTLTRTWLISAITMLQIGFNITVHNKYYIQNELDVNWLGMDKSALTRCE